MYPFLFIVVGLWAAVFITTVIILAVSAFNRGVSEQGKSLGLFCTFMGVRPSLVRRRFSSERPTGVLV
jgi:hypothetical protein